MKQSIDSELLVDLVEDTLPSGFRAGLLARSIKTAQRARAFRLSLRVLTVVGLACGGSLWLKDRSASTSIVQRNTLPPALKAPEIVIVRTAVLPANLVVHSSPEATVSIRTNANVTVPLVSDEQLLAAFGDQPVVLVRAPGQAPRLIYPGR